MWEQAAGKLIQSAFRTCIKENHSSLKIENQRMRDHHVFSLPCAKESNSEVKTSRNCRMVKRKVTKKSTSKTTQNASTPTKHAEKIK